MSGATHTIHGACSGGIVHDITGKRFGRLVAIEPTDERATNGGIRWKCICDCGNIVYPTMNNLKRKHTTSCGCVKEDFIESCKIDIIGKKFGYLTVLSEEKSIKGERRKVKCLCKCGNIHICSVTDLTTKHTMSCGCMCKSKGELYIEEILQKLNIDLNNKRDLKIVKIKSHFHLTFICQNIVHVLNMMVNNIINQ